MRSWKLGACGLGTLLLVAAAAHGSEAEPPAATDFAGAWRIAVPVQEERAYLSEVIERGTEDMPGLRRHIARKRLHAKNDVIQRVRMAFSAGSIEIVLDGDRYRTPADGKLVKVTLDDGEVVNVAQSMTNGRIVQRFVAKDGVRTDVFTLSPDRCRLTMHVIITSGRLKHPIRYQTPYRR